MLSQDTFRYLSHKLHLADVSGYYRRPEVKSSIMWAQSMLQTLKFNSLMNERELAHTLICGQKHLENLLPYRDNKSYDSSLKALQKIINHCSELLRPKTA